MQLEAVPEGSAAFSLVDSISVDLHTTPVIYLRALPLLQDDLLDDDLPGGAADDALPSEDDELDASPCMLPLVRLIERAAELSQPGGALIPKLLCWPAADALLQNPAQYMYCCNLRHLHVSLEVHMGVRFMWPAGVVAAAELLLQWLECPNKPLPISQRSKCTLPSERSP